MGEKSWIYWVGLIIVAIAVVGLIKGATGLIMPIPRLHLRGEIIGGLIPFMVRAGAMKIIGSLVFLVTGIYMMISGRNSQ